MSRWLEELNERRRVARAEVLGRWAEELLPVPPVFVAELSAELWRREGELRVACVLTFPAGQRRLLPPLSSLLMATLGPSARSTP